jgi:hypothetical protein
MLLSDEETQVSSENTIFYTMDRWLQYNPRGTERRRTSKEQQQELAYLLRLPHCTPSYLTSVICAPGSWILRCFSPTDLISVAAVCAGGRGSSSAGSEGDVSSSEEAWATGLMSSCDAFYIPGRMSAWALPPREPSSMSSLKLEVKTPLSKVKELYEKGMACEDLIHESHYGEYHRWQGRELALAFTLHAYKDPDTPEQFPVLKIGTDLIWEENVRSPVTSVAGVVLWKGEQVMKRKLSFLDGFDNGTVNNPQCELVSDWIGGLPSTWEAARMSLEVDGLVYEDTLDAYILHEVVITGFR